VFPVTICTLGQALGAGFDQVSILCCAGSIPSAVHMIA